MTNSGERESATPGLSDIWQFWRTVELGDANAAKSHVEVLVKLESLDRETKVAVVHALAELRKNRRVKPVGASDSLRKEIKLQIIPRPNSKRRDPSLESSTNTQLQAFNSIMGALKNGKTGEALQIYSNLPYQNDRAKVLCLLIAMKPGQVKLGYARLTSDVAAREGITSLDIPLDQRTEIVTSLFQIYIDKLSR